MKLRMTSIPAAGVAALPIALLVCVGRATPASADNPICGYYGPDTCAFSAPWGTSSCQISLGGQGPTVYCQTVPAVLGQGPPPQSVAMDADGTLTPCTGVACVGNAATGTPTLALGHDLSVGPFTCLSAATEVSCTVTSGRGFIVSETAITPVG
jgi:hypothetical protein